MTESVIQVFEIIKVDMRQCAPGSIPTGTCQLALAGLFEATTVQRTGQWVGASHLARLSKCFFKLCNTQFCRQQLKHAGFPDEGARETDDRSGRPTRHGQTGNTGRYGGQRKTTMQTA
jgi:hypothetical protein